MAFEKTKALRRGLFSVALRIFEVNDYLVSPAGAAGAAGVAAGVASVPGAAGAAGVAAGVPSAGVAVAAGVASVVGAGAACSAGWFLEQVKPVVKERASKAAITIAFIVVVSLRIN